MKEKKGKGRNEKRMRKKLLSWCVVLSMVLTAAVGVFISTPTAISIEEEEELGIEVPTLRVYGNDNEGAGDTSVGDPEGAGAVEDPPYTDAIAPFDPQHEQAPVKDSITFNPVYLSETESDDELLGGATLAPYTGPYSGRILASGGDAYEKVFFRQWYEPWHWDKDVNGDGTWKGRYYDPDELFGEYQYLRHYPVYELQEMEILDPDDEIYPAIMQEFTYMFIEAKPLASKPEPKYGVPGISSFMFPIGIKWEYIDDPYGYGLTGIDATPDDNVPGDEKTLADAITIESEKTMFEETGLAVDFNGNQYIDPLDTDGYELTGDELVIFRTGKKELGNGGRIQFLDHMIEVVDTYLNPESVKVAIYYTGGLEPELLGHQLISAGDMALVGRKMPVTYIKAVVNGGNGTNLCDFPTGPWFIYVDSVHTDLETADIMVGRALGHTHTAMEDGTEEQDLRHGDPWWLKRFYVDGHEYNVVAIETIGNDANWAINTTINDLDQEWADPANPEEYDNDEIEFYPLEYEEDSTGFKYITIRTTIPKSGERQNPEGVYPEHEIVYAYRDKEYSVQGGDASTIRNLGYYHLIDQHSVKLQPYFVNDSLSVLPPFNYEHSILIDIQPNWSAIWDDEEEEWITEPEWLGELKTRIPPITEVVGDHITMYDETIVSEQMLYVDEDINPEYKGELKEKYRQYEGNDCPGLEIEEWYVEQWHTLPDMYTEFVLPEQNGSLYLLTSAFTSDEAIGRILIQDKDNKFPKNPDEIQYINIPDGNRVKFWFNPSDVVRDEETGEIINKGDLKKYKCEDGIRIYGFDSEGAGDPDVECECKPYTDPEAPFNPQHLQAPRKDSITFNPAYMDQYHHGGEPLSDLYKYISIEESDAREKVFHRMWYEPWHWDKDENEDGDMYGSDMDGYEDVGEYLLEHPEDQEILDWSISELKGGNPDGLEILDSEDVIYQALMQEFTYMYVNVYNKPDHGQPGTSSIAFPIGTDWDELWDPYGYGITTFDANFDGEGDICRIHSEKSLSQLTGIQADFNGDYIIQELDQDGIELNGNELVIFAVENLNLEKDGYAMFLTHMVKLEDVTTGPAAYAKFRCWSARGTDTDATPWLVSGETFKLKPGEMVIIKHVTVSSPFSTSNLGRKDGAWFIYCQAIEGDHDRVVVTMGRAFGCTHSKVTDDDWYMKRFYVDGHEYEVVAIKTIYEPTPKEEDYEFKYITIRTPIPKEPVIITQHSQYLQDYGICNNISIMPPFNYEHTAKRDIQSGWKDPYTLSEMDYKGEIIKNKPPLVIHIKDEAREPQFKGELKEKYNKRPEVVLGLFNETQEYNGTTKTLYISGPAFGEVDGRFVTGYFKGVIDMDSGSPTYGDILWGYWVLRPDGDSPLIYNQNTVSEFDGTIEGHWDYVTKELHMTWFRDALGLVGDTLNEDYLCFWAEFHLDAVREDNNLSFSPEHSSPSKLEFVYGGWDPLRKTIPYWNISINATESGGLEEEWFNFSELPGEDWEVWMTEQWHTMPDQYTELTLPDDGQLYLLTSSWYTGEAKIRIPYYDEGEVKDDESTYEYFWVPDGADKVTVKIEWENAVSDLDLYLYDPSGDEVDSSSGLGNMEIVTAPVDKSGLWSVKIYGFEIPTARDPEIFWKTIEIRFTGNRVKFWYDPGDCKDIYVNTAWIGAPPLEELPMEGDVSGDGHVNILDVVMLQAYLADSVGNPLNSTQLTSANTHEVGEPPVAIGIVDVVYIQAWLADDTIPLWDVTHDDGVTIPPVH